MLSNQDLDFYLRVIQPVAEAIVTLNDPQFNKPDVKPAVDIILPALRQNFAALAARLTAVTLPVI